jgi:hypothetical protein
LVLDHLVFAQRTDFGDPVFMLKVLSLACPAGRRISVVGERRLAVGVDMSDR